MRKIYTLVCIILFGLGANALAQNNSVTIPEINSATGPVTVQIDYDFTFDDVYSFEILVLYDPTELTYLSYSEGDIPDDVDFQIDGATPGEVDIAWAKSSPRDDAGVLIYLEFDYQGTEGTTEITFRETTYLPGHESPTGDNPSWLGDDSAPVKVITCTFNDGSITHVPMVPLAAWGVLLGVVLIAAFAVTRFYRIV